MTVVRELYAARFSEDERARRAAIWRVLERHVFRRWIQRDATVVDLGAGQCEFLNVITARRRVAVDLNATTASAAAPGVEVHAVSAEHLDFLKDDEADLVFSSNFFEHLPSRQVLINVLQEAARVLRPGGRLLAMGPNVRLIPGTYWDFFDHVLPLSDRSIQEALRVSGFEIERVMPRFLPYTTKSWLPQRPWLVRAYLALHPLSSLLFGAQFLVVARKVARSPRP